MKIEEFKELFEEWVSTLEDQKDGEIEWLVCNIVHDEFGVPGLMSVKIREQLLSKELMFVRSDLVFIEKGTNEPATFTVSIQSKVDSLEEADITYSNFMNLTCKESSIEDLEAILPVLKFHKDCPHINNLLSLAYRIRSMDSTMQIRYRQGLLYRYPLKEVGELAIAI